MSGCAHDHASTSVDDTGCRRALVIVLLINAAMFAVEGWPAWSATRWRCRLMLYTSLATQPPMPSLVSL
jgi:hypothetical protein